MLLSTVKSSIECCILVSISEVKKYRKKLLKNFELQQKLTKLEYLYGLYDFVTLDLQKEYAEEIKSLCNCCLDFFQESENKIQLVVSPIETINSTWINFCYTCEEYSSKWIINSIECEITSKWIAYQTECEKYPFKWIINTLCCQVIPSQKVDKLEEMSSGNVRFGIGLPSVLFTDKENDTYIQTDNGLATGQVLDTFVFDKDSNTWISQSENEITYTAGVNINSHTPVVLVNNLLFPLDHTILTHQYSFVGFTKTSANIGGQVGIETERITLTGWGLTTNQTYLAGVNGGLLTNNTTSGSFTKIIGMAESSDTLLIFMDYDAIIVT